MYKNKILANLLPLFVITLSAAQCTTSPSAVPEALSTTSGYGLIYYSDREDADDFAGIEFGGLYLTDLATKEEKYLTEGGVVSIYESFSWSPVTRKLVYTERGNDVSNENELELYLLDLNGNKIRLTNNDVNDSDGNWSPDGQTIAFWSSRPDESWLYLMNSDGSNVRPFFDSDPGLEFGFLSVWAPNGQKLAISTLSSLDRPIDLNNLQDNFQIVEVGSTKISQTLPDDRVRTDFSWSPDSNKLVYLSNPVDLNSFQKVYKTMYVLDTQTQEETLIAEFAIIGTPHWSPVEDVIAFSATTTEEMNSGELNVYLINGDGTGLKRMTDDGFYRVASWSPDGKKLALEFIGEQLADFEIYIFDIESRTLEQVTDNNVYDAFPIWVEP